MSLPAHTRRTNARSVDLTKPFSTNLKVTNPQLALTQEGARPESFRPPISDLTGPICTRRAVLEEQAPNTPSKPRTAPADGGRSQDEVSPIRPASVAPANCPKSATNLRHSSVLQSLRFLKKDGVRRPEGEVGPRACRAQRGGLAYAASSK